MNRVWHYLILEPGIWIFYCFFQPTRFKMEVEHERPFTRVTCLCRTAFPIFLISYLLALILRFVFHLIYPAITLFIPEDQPVSFLFAIAQLIVFGLLGSLVIGLLGSISLGIISGLSLGIVWGAGLGFTGGNDLALTGGVAIVIMAGILVGIAQGRTWGRLGGILGALTSGITWAFSYNNIANNAAYDTSQAPMGGAIIAIAFLLSYLIGHYRLLLYPISGLSGLRAYMASRENPEQVFIYLHRSSLYWDEHIFLPLPKLSKMLVIASQQDLAQAQKEINYIISSRPLQLYPAKQASIEIALSNLEQRETLSSIARASQRLTNILPNNSQLLDSHWQTLFAHISDASRDAARYTSASNIKSRHSALEEMTQNLEKIRTTTASSTHVVHKRLNKMAARWMLIARNEQIRLRGKPQLFTSIDNPYKPGKVLELSDSLFVGRRDVVQQLEESLGRGNSRPTFFLNGERRMGKSSTLKQLTHLLGARYIPLIYDLQSRGISSSAAAFFTTIAGEIVAAMSIRGINAKVINAEQLKEAGRSNEAEVYFIFDRWLDAVESTLREKDRVILLVFDEFEKLEEADQDGFLKLSLLLDWFRSAIQNRAQLALLFSGVHSIGDMRSNWASYFVNVQTLQVSFLHPEEARTLIIYPIHGFPSQHIYSEEVVKEIMRVTGSHPFLVQAVCSQLIDMLNTERRTPARVEDVGRAQSQMLENWWDTYFRDLWERTDQDQSTCLNAICILGSGSKPEGIAMQSKLDIAAVRKTLQTLRKRDLVLSENDAYRIASPIFEKWIQQNISLEQQNSAQSE